ncbi:hypothetical protein KA005_42045 [bacterium]|nr:hypothetical protein [bacterium]
MINDIDKADPKAAGGVIGSWGKTNNRAKLINEVRKEKQTAGWICPIGIAEQAR